MTLKECIRRLERRMLWLQDRIGNSEKPRGYDAAEMRALEKAIILLKCYPPHMLQQGGNSIRIPNGDDEDEDEDEDDDDEAGPLIGLRNI